MEIKVTKKDILSGYIAQIFNYGTGLIVLPVVLHKLSAEEVGMNYIMLSLGALANMADYGFSGQIGRNVTYVLSGAQKIYRDEIEILEKHDKINYTLLKTIIDASKYLYAWISLAVLLLLLTLGTVYMYNTTNGFTNVENSFVIWILFSFSIFFNIYFLYYNSLLQGAALIMEQRAATIYSRIAYIIICFVLIFAGFGLLGVVAANLISPFVARYYSYKKFYSKEMKSQLSLEKSKRSEITGVLKDMWVTARKSGTNTIGHYISTQGGMFIAGIYLPLGIIAQWGLLTQLMGVAQGFSMNLVMSDYPEYCKYRLLGEKEKYIMKTSFDIASMVVFLTISGFVVIFLGPFLVRLIGSNTQLPSTMLMFLYVLYLIILCNAQSFAMMMTSRNVIPSPKAVLISCVAQVILTIIFLHFFDLGLWSLLLGPAIAGCSYTLFAWPIIELRDMKVSAITFYRTGLSEIWRLLIKYI